MLEGVVGIVVRIVGGGSVLIPLDYSYSLFAKSTTDDGRLSITTQSNKTHVFTNLYFVIVILLHKTLTNDSALEIVHT
ncbi:Hypothetical predicted protein [Octopus vulgaris]|uniref:Uncharacterized protein n=1 Tax=Octopus vulgaris TaxID=6645 RepID=A0AA36BV16_OCTVU|nr:Hypothetical predicted protein [Octopus vulgaris]